MAFIYDWIEACMDFFWGDEGERDVRPLAPLAQQPASKKREWKPLDWSEVWMAPASDHLTLRLVQKLRGVDQYEVCPYPTEQQPLAEFSTYEAARAFMREHQFVLVDGRRTASGSAGDEFEWIEIWSDECDFHVFYVVSKCIGMERVQARSLYSQESPFWFASYEEAHDDLREDEFHRVEGRIDQTYW